METKKEKYLRIIQLALELGFQLSGMIILYNYLGLGVCLGLFLLTTGLNMQNSRNAEKTIRNKFK